MLVLHLRLSKLGLVRRHLKLGTLVEKLRQLRLSGSVLVLHLRLSKLGLVQRHLKLGMLVERLGQLRLSGSRLVLGLRLGNVGLRLNSRLGELVKRLGLALIIQGLVETLESLR